MMFQFHHHHHHHHHHLILLLLSRTTASRQIIKPLLLINPSLLPSSLLLNTKWYSQRKEDNDEHEIGEKARSVAEEFDRVAKEKGGFVSQSVEDAWEGTIEAVSETVQRGEHDVEAVKNKHQESAAKVEREK